MVLNCFNLYQELQSPRNKESFENCNFEQLDLFQIFLNILCYCSQLDLDPNISDIQDQSFSPNNLDKETQSLSVRFDGWFDN